MRHFRIAAGVLLAAVAAGCFPITVSVDPDGRIALVRDEGVVVWDVNRGAASVVVKPEGGKAAWVMFSKDGQSLLYAVTAGDSPKDLYVCKADGTGAKKVYSSASAMAYALWSPDGKYISVGDVSQESKNDLPNLINVKLITVATRDVRVLCEDTTQIHDWLSDSSGVVAFVAEKKAGAAKPAGGDQPAAQPQGMQGKLVKVALDGTKTPLLSAIVGKNTCVDCSHDGKEVLLTASAAGAPGEELVVPEKAEECALYSYSFADKKATKLAAPSVESAFFSPDGKRILISRGGEGANLVVLDRQGKNATTVATGILNVTEGMDSTRVLATWLSNDTVVYWQNRVVVGMNGKAITTFSVKIDGSGRTNLQKKLESLIPD